MATNDKFCVWNDGPVVEAWQVWLERSRVTVYCRTPATEAEVRAHCATLYVPSYGRVLSAARMSEVPSYCAAHPMACCPA